MTKCVEITEAQLLRYAAEARTLSGKPIQVFNVLIAIAVSDTDGRVARSYGEAQFRRGVTVDSSAETFHFLRTSLPFLEGKVIDLESKQSMCGSIRAVVASLLSAQSSDTDSSASESLVGHLQRHPFAGAFFGLESALIGAIARYLDQDVSQILGASVPGSPAETTQESYLLLPKKLMGTDGLAEMVAEEEKLRHLHERWFDIGRRLTANQTIRWIKRALRHTGSHSSDRTLYCYRPLKRSLESDYPLLLNTIRNELSPEEAAQVRVAIDFNTPATEALLSEFSGRVVRVLRPTALGSFLDAHELLNDPENSVDVPIYLIDNSGGSKVGTYWIHQLANSSPKVPAVLTADRWENSTDEFADPLPTPDFWRSNLAGGLDGFQTTGEPFLHSIGEKANYYDEEQFLEPMGPIGAKARLLQKAALLAGYSTVQYTKSAFAIIDNNNDSLFFHGSATPLNSAGAKAICNDKETTRLMLQQHGIPVPQGRSFNSGDFDTARAYAKQLGYPVVVKPAMGTMGIGVKAGIRDEAELDLAFEHLMSSRLANQGFIVEKHIEGEEYRILVVGDEVVAAVRREAASVIGDGIHNVAELILRKNMFRRTNPQLASSPIVYTGDTEHLLDEQRLTLSHVVEKNRYVKLASSSNISLGGDSREVLDLLHPSIVTASIKAVKAVPGLNYCGVDFILPNPELSLDEQSAGICELNAQAASGTAEYPLFGPHRPVPQKTIEQCTRIYDTKVRAPGHPELLAVHLRIRGRVTGVGYRKWFKKWADEFGVVGHIFNAGRRTVEVEMQGDPLAVAALAAAAISGPRKARPTSVHTRHRRRLRARSFEIAEQRPRRARLWSTR